MHCEVAQTLGFWNMLFIVIYLLFIYNIYIDIYLALTTIGWVLYVNTVILRGWEATVFSEWKTSYHGW